MFKPGHLSRILPESHGHPQGYVDLTYEVRDDPAEGKMLHFNMSGEIDGKPFQEAFELHRDMAFNFASVVSHVAARHGVPVEHSLILQHHEEYDAMFEDIRARLDLHPGEPVNFDHLNCDHF